MNWFQISSHSAFTSRSGIRFIRHTASTKSKFSVAYSISRNVLEAEDYAIECIADIKRRAGGYSLTCHYNTVTKYSRAESID